MTALERICLNLLLLVFISCRLEFSLADGSTSTCISDGKDASACRRSPHRTLTERKVFADYAPGSQEEEEQDEDDGADLMMHMQMRVNVDMPLEAPKAAKMSLAGAAATHTSKSNPKPRDNDVMAKAAVARPLPPTAALSLLEEDAVEVPARPASEFVDNEGAEPAATASSLPGIQLVIGALAAAFLVAIGAWLATSVGRSAEGRNKVASEEELKTRAKAWMLDWALSYEPDDVEDEAAIEAEIKVRPKKKAPPITAGSDSGDTDEEEPEAESDYGELLEDAVFVAEQVEVANRHNEAVDNDYGIPEARLVDQIQHCDLR